MAWWEGLNGSHKYELQRAVKKDKKAADKETKKYYFGSWNPYTNLKPYIQLKVFICLCIPFLSWVAYNHLAGNWPDSGGPFALVIFAAIVGVPIYYIGAALWLVQPGYSHPGAVNLECPGCYHGGKPGQDSKGYAENFFAFLWNRVSLISCPKCSLEFEIENMSQFGWPYDDEPHPGEKYGDSSKIRVKPKVPLRFGSFILKKQPGFHSQHYELIKVGPIAALLIGVPWYFGYLTEILMLLVITVCFNLFVWRHEALQGARKEAVEILEDLEILPKDYVPVWWKTLIINIVFVIIGIVVLFVAPGVFGISTG